MKVTTVRLSEELAEKVEEAAGRTERSQSDYIRHALRSHIETESNTPNLEERVADLEERVSNLESAQEPPQTEDSRLRTDSRPHDPHPSTPEDRVVEDSSTDEATTGGLSEEIAALDLPGSADSSEGRRAIRAMYEYVRQEGRAQKSDFVDAVYPDHPVRYGSSDTWWNAVGRETEGKEGFMSLARRRDDLLAPEGRGQRHFEFVGGGQE